jgi:lipopolysaccharide biosynthesis glycosyltransferase
MKTKINLAFCIDKNYVQHLGITLASIFINNNSCDLSIYIISPGLDDEHVEKLTAVARPFDIELNFRQGEDPRTDGLKEFQHISRATYYRLLIPEILEGINKIIYLDCDLVVETDLLELWNVNVSDAGCAGVDEVNTPHAERLGVPLEYYINAGVMLLNTEFWRQNGITKKCLDWLNSNIDHATLLEQDAINVVLNGSKKSISRKWNLNPAPERDMKTLIEYPQRILHFAGPLKPWHKCFDFTLQKIYAKYVAMTPWLHTFIPAEPRNAAQACLLANQLFKINDYFSASNYYKIALSFQLSKSNSNLKILIDYINDGDKHFNNRDYWNACEHYQSCLEYFGYPKTYDSVYNMPNILDGIY